MNTFFQGLRLGFAQGMLNNMFGGFSAFGFSPFGFNSFGFSPFGFGSFGFNPFGMGMNFGMGMFGMTGFNSFPAPSVFMTTPVSSGATPMDSIFVMPQMVTSTPSSTAAFTDMFVSSYNYNPFPNTEDNEIADNDTKEKAELSEAELLMPHKLCARWSVKDISKDAELTPEFCEKVIEISKRVKCNPDDLMALMYSECRFNPGAENDANKKGNVGLIQFGAAARKELGVTKEQLLNMSAIEQLDYVEKYIQDYRTDNNYSDEDYIDTGTLAAIVFRPAYAEQEVLARRGSDAYRKNKPLDINKDGKITKTDLAKRLRGYQ